MSSSENMIKHWQRVRSGYLIPNISLLSSVYPCKTLLCLSKGKYQCSQNQDIFFTRMHWILHLVVRSSIGHISFNFWRIFRFLIYFLWISEVSIFWCSKWCITCISKTFHILCFWRDSCWGKVSDSNIGAMISIWK